MSKIPYQKEYFVDREEHLLNVLNKVRDLLSGKPVHRRTTVFYGPRGAGKSWLIRELCRRLLQDGEFQGRLSLLYLTFDGQEIRWEETICSCISPEDAEAKPRKTTEGILTWACRRLSPDCDPGDSMEEMSEQLVDICKADAAPLAIFVDGIDNVSPEFLRHFEAYFLAPLIQLPRVLVVLGGRTRDPRPKGGYTWKMPELKLYSDELDLEPFDEEQTREQLARLEESGSPITAKAAPEVVKAGGGYPLHNVVLAQNIQGEPPQWQNRAAALQECAESVLESVEAVLQDHFQALCVLRAFDEDRMPPLLAAWFETPSSVWDYQRCRRIRSSMVTSRLVRWQAPKGFVMDQGVSQVLENALQENQPSKWHALHRAAYELFVQWVESYPSAKDRWQPEAEYHSQYVEPDESKRTHREETNRPISLSDLEHHLLTAGSILRGKVHGLEYLQHLFCLLFLKRISDAFEEQYEAIIEEQMTEYDRTEAEARKRAERRVYYSDSFYVPPRARWSYLRDEARTEVGEKLNIAIAMLEEENREIEGTLGHMSFTRQVGGRARLDDKTLREVIEHFSKVRLRDEDLEFPRMFSAAYDHLIEDFTNSASSEVSRFYTPRGVVQLMVSLLQPEQGMRIYDPCVGYGGTLVRSCEYVREAGGNPQDLSLYGQEINLDVWAVCRMSLFLHGIRDADIRSGDTLVDPKHLSQSGELMRFDRVISTPPFSRTYDKRVLAFRERFLYGYTSRSRADLMYLQHMLSVVKPGGRVVSLMPRGVLFRGRVEQEIRKSIVQEGLLEAVIGLPPNLFPETSIPTCILVLRAEGSKPPERQGRVLFIDAETDYARGQRRNSLKTAHIDEVVTAFQSFRDVKHYARVVTIDELAKNDFSLEISQYVGTSSKPGVSAAYLSLSHSARVGASVGDTIQLTLLLTPDCRTEDSVLIRSDQSEITLFIQAEDFHIEEGQDMVTLPFPTDRVGDIEAVVELHAMHPGAHQVVVEPFVDDRRYDSLTIPISVRLDKDVERLELPSPLNPRSVPQPDLCLRIYPIPLNSDISRLRLEYVLYSPHYSLRLPGVPVGSVEVSVARLVRLHRQLDRSLKRGAQQSSTSLGASLDSIGRELYNMLFSPELEEVYQEVHAKISSWLILSDAEPWIPWELVKPHGRDWKHGFLGMHYRLGRWIEGWGTPRQAEFPIGPVYVAQDAGSMEFRDVGEWKQLVSGGDLARLNDPLFIDLPGGYPEAAAYRSPAWGLHFESCPTSLGAAQQALVVQETEGLSPEYVAEYRLNLHKKRSLVTFGTLTLGGRSALTGVERNWMPTLIRSGAGAFVGSFWATDPQADRVFWRAFYQALWNRTPIGEAVFMARQSLRQALPDRFDWLSYFLVGDPMARGYVPQPGEGYVTLECRNHNLEKPLQVGQEYSFVASLRIAPPPWYTGRLYETKGDVWNDPQIFVFAPGFDAPREYLPIDLQGGNLGSTQFCLIPRIAGTQDIFVKFLAKDEVRQSLTLQVDVESSEV